MLYLKNNQGKNIITFAFFAIIKLLNKLKKKWSEFLATSYP